LTFLTLTFMHDKP